MSTFFEAFLPSHSSNISLKYFIHEYVCHLKKYILRNIKKRQIQSVPKVKLPSPTVMEVPIQQQCKVRFLPPKPYSLHMIHNWHVLNKPLLVSRHQCSPCNN